jgi:undecaprenyl-diphosphatase
MSWSQKMFLKINNMVGKNKLRDTFFYVCGQYLIWVLVVSCAGSFFVYGEDIVSLGFFVVPTLLAFGFSYGFAYIFPHRRPIVEHPTIAELIVPLSTWKSFPSDHTIAALLLSYGVFLFSGSWILFGVCLLLAMCVMMGRVYCGVHYPRDIMGGIMTVAVSIIISYVMIVSFLLWYGGSALQSF